MLASTELSAQSIQPFRQILVSYYFLIGDFMCI